MNNPRHTAVIAPAFGPPIETAAALLRDGQLVAFPTETVYGLGADARNGEAVARIFAAKGRPRFNPLIVHVTSVEAARNVGEMTLVAERLAEKFWPGPLTLVLKKRDDSGLSGLVSAGLDTVAVRVPAHPTAAALLAACGFPVAAPSANRSGHVSATQAQHVVDDLGSRVAMVLDGGATPHGVESTVVDATAAEPVLLRSGSVTAEMIEAVLGMTLLRATDNHTRPQSPGQLKSHYEQRAGVRLNATDVRSGEALLAFGVPVPKGAFETFNLSPDGNLIQAAALLFAALRALDASGAKTIAVMPIPETGLGEAINDRLRRAAAPRDL